DPEAIEVARANAALNPEATGITFITGEPASIGETAHEAIVANLSGSILERVIGDLVQRLAAGGFLILSGLLATETAEIAALAESKELRRVRACSSEGWSAVLFE